MAKYLFICQDGDPEAPEIFIETKETADLQISLQEGLDKEMTFRVIGRINTAGLTPDFPTDIIEWFEEIPSKRIVDDAVVKIIQRLSNKYI